MLWEWFEGIDVAISSENQAEDTVIIYKHCDTHGLIT